MDVEQLGAGSGTEGVQPLLKSALELVRSHGGRLRRDRDRPNRDRDRRVGPWAAGRASHRTVVGRNSSSSSSRSGMPNSPVPEI